MHCPKCDDLLVLVKVVIETNQVFLPDTKRHYIIHEHLACNKCHGLVIFNISVPMAERDTKNKILDEMDKIIGESEIFAEQIKEMDKTTKVAIFQVERKDGDDASSEF